MKYPSESVDRAQEVPQRPKKTPAAPPISESPTHSTQQPRQSSPQLPQHNLGGDWRCEDLLRHDCGLAKRLALAGDRHLVTQFRDQDEEQVLLSSLQRMVMHNLQAKLMNVVGDIHNTGSADNKRLVKATDLLEQYCTAVQNMDYMTQKQLKCSRNGEKDPFVMSSTEILSFRLMEDARLLPNPILGRGDARDYLALKRGISDGSAYENGKSILPGTARHTSNELQLSNLFVERLAIGALGGLALIAPVLIMVLHRDLLTSLLTTSVATLLFAGALAFWGSSLGAGEVLGAVAAYAAVLVVFIGTNS